MPKQELWVIQGRVPLLAPVFESTILELEPVVQDLQPPATITAATM